MGARAMRQFSPRALSALRTFARGEEGEVHAVGIGADEDKVVCEDQVDRLLELGFLLGRCERRQPGLGAPGVEVVDPHDALHGMDAAPRHETRGLEEQGADPAGKAAVRSFCENLLS